MEKDERRDKPVLGVLAIVAAFVVAVLPYSPVQVGGFVRTWRWHLVVLGIGFGVWAFWGGITRVLRAMGRWRELRWRIPAGWEAVRHAHPPTSKSQEEIQAIESVRVLLRGFGLRAADTATDLLAIIRSHNTDGASFAWLVDRVYDELREARRGVDSLIADDSAVRLDGLSAALSRFHRGYCSGVRCVYSWEQAGVRLNDEYCFPRYSVWRAAHDPYVQRLSETALHSRLGGIRQSIQAETDALWTVALHEDHSLGRRFLALLREPTPAERLFLDQFCGPEIRRDPDTSSTWLLYPVYRAGCELARRGLLRRGEEIEGVATFEIPAAALYAWRLHGPPPYPTRERLLLSLDTVFGSGASGSGAPHGRES